VLGSGAGRELSVARSTDAWVAAQALLDSGGGEQTDRMARNVLCLIGVHRWVRRRNEDGEEHTECSRCGTYNVTPQEGGTPPPLG
jgi:hypothetical protein